MASIYTVTIQTETETETHTAHHGLHEAAPSWQSVYEGTTAIPLASQVQQHSAGVGCCLVLHKFDELVELHAAVHRYIHIYNIRHWRLSRSPSLSIFFFFERHH